MKRFLILAICLVWVCRLMAQLPNPVQLAATQENPPPSGGGLAEFSDDFQRGDESPITTPWTVISGAVNLVDNEAFSPNPFDNGVRAAAYTSEACTTVNQYVKITITASTGANNRGGAAFRYTDGSSPIYVLRADDLNDQLQWIRQATPGGSEDTIDFEAHAVSWPLTLGVTLEGTGDSTVMRVWISPTDNTPTDAATWDAGAADYTLDANPASPVNTGSFVGFEGLGAFGDLGWDDFYGGDIPP